MSTDGPPAGIAKALNIQPDPPTPSPRTALFRKRKFEQASDSETDDEEEEGCRRPEPPVGSADYVRGGRVYVDGTLSSRGSLLDGEVGGRLEMSGALQHREGVVDDSLLYSDT